ncbi:MAG TPA: hypothetical protein PKA95_15540, partial [Thermomicrobiales bacterium]|nr:hypothetical protein [Thermomicrobiales bacterium]
FVSPSPTVRTSYSTFNEARPFVPFVLAEPVLGEDGIELTSVDVLSDAGTPAQVAGVAAYYLYYGAAQPIQFHQHLGACVDFSGENGPEITEQQTIELGGKFVRETHAVTKDGMPVADYRWGGNGVCYFVFGVVPDDVALDRIQQLVGAIPLSPSVDGPAATATFSVPEISAFTDDRALVTITLDYGHGDTSIVLRGRGFPPETSVSIFAGPFVGDSEPRWMVDETVLADGTFSLALAPEALAKWCDETTPDRACRISATPGRVTQMPDTAEPSAFTVFTFAEHTPDEVLNRAPLPSCGVAVSLDGPQGDNGEDARRCFVAAVIAGRSAELVTHQQMVEGDIVTAIYRTTGDGVVLRYADATRDRFGSGIWTVTSCQASRDANQDPGDLRFPRCDAAVPLD